MSDRRNNTWQLQDAKAHLSEVVRASQDEAQFITLRGKEAAVVISAENYERLRADRPSLAAFFRASPLVGSGIRLERDAAPSRRPNAFKQSRGKNP